MACIISNFWKIIKIFLVPNQYIWNVKMFKFLAALAFHRAFWLILCLSTKSEFKELIL